MAKKAKARPPLKGGHQAPPLVAEAIRQYLKTKAKAEILQSRMAALRKIIMAGGCGSAHGYRTYVYDAPAWRGYVTKKGGPQLKFVEIPVASTPSSEVV